MRNQTEAQMKEELNAQKFKMHNVNEELPFDKTDEGLPSSHERLLYIRVKEFGYVVGFYRNGNFMKNYACIYFNVLEWMYLPND